MRRGLYLLIAVAAVGLLLQLTPRRTAAPAAPTPATPAAEADLDAFGRLVAGLRAGKADGSLSAAAAAAHPELARLLLGQPETEEERLTQEYLFGTPERAQKSLTALGQWLCFWRLDVVWPGPRETTKPPELPAWAVCPVDGTRYHSGKVGTVAFLQCPSHRLVLRSSFPAPENLPTEDTRQLAMGYFSEKRSHNLDAALDPAAPSGIRPGETVVDLGAGVGCYTWPMARRAGPKGRVIAVDVDPGVLQFIDFVAERRPELHVETVLATRESPHLDAGVADRIFMVDVYNVIVGTELEVHGEPGERSSAYMVQVAKALKPGGRLVLVDFLPEGGLLHVPEEAAVKEIGALGLELLDRRRLETVNMYVLTFRKASGT